MSKFIYFGAIFATRFRAGKDLRITDSNEAQKAAWLAAGGKLIAADPQYLTLSPNFIVGENLIGGKSVSMDGGRYICRLPIVDENTLFYRSPDYCLFHQWATTIDKPVLFFAQQNNQIVVSQITPYSDLNFSIELSYDFPTDAHFLKTVGFLPVLEPIMDYSPTAMLNQKVVIVMPNDILRGTLASCTDYDIVLKPDLEFDSDPVLDPWGKWLEDGFILLDRTAMLNLFPQP